ncbi:MULTISPECIES: helix-turn-helix domain-containing protein [Streptomyces]|nr:MULTISPECIES: helix-turn-helix transcriptional regulator [Streptomyces]KOG75620.1 DNA-binding protein [Kitasatospora aureofaciens]KOT46360.1 DNA-binding protein [Streptomyces rimosus subsp. rimosus]KOT47577.1 DNA-binding protein [Streptomyces sp. NRRL WC-3701]KOT61861.1 DNA-binding protein [Streptomyces rimosus subsp. rimosus]KOT63457.1 DNA-binding protein [Streptomyces rimosus subsp. rimosus]
MAPVLTPNHGAGRLALELRRARSRRDLSRPELAHKIGRSLTTVQRAEAGRIRPPWPVIRDIAAVCGMDLDTAEDLWRKAGRPGRTRRTEAPLLSLVRTPGDLAAVLRRAWEDDGAPSLRTMEARAERLARTYAPLSRMSAWRIRERKQTLSSLHQLYAYLIACEVAEEDFPAWEQAWRRAGHHEERSPRPAARAGQRRTTSLDRAAALMRQAGLLPCEPFPGRHTPWTARCRSCGKLSRYKFSQVLEGTSCPVCHHPHAVLYAGPEEV